MLSLVLNELQGCDVRERVTRLRGSGTSVS